MSAYIPGSGLKKPLNMFESPIYPDIKKGPPRFRWTEKHWTVDTGRTMMQAQDVPQMYESAVLYQSYDYNSQHAYGNNPTYTTFVNKEFRPPPQDRDDILPLSRIPRPTIVPRINPGGAHSSGNSVFAEQNINIPGVEKYLTDRVKQGEIRKTFYAPIDIPLDNSVLPDLETKLPTHSAYAGYTFPAWGKVEIPDFDLPYQKFHPSVVAGINVNNMGNPFSNATLEDNTFELLDYNRPQVSSSAGHNNVRSGSGLDEAPIRELFTKVEGTQEINLNPNTQYKSDNSRHNVAFKHKVDSLDHYNQMIPQNYIPTKARSNPQAKIKQGRGPKGVGNQLR